MFSTLISSTRSFSGWSSGISYVIPSLVYKRRYDDVQNFNAPEHVSLKLSSFDNVEETSFKQSTAFRSCTRSNV